MTGDRFFLLFCVIIAADLTLLTYIVGQTGFTRSDSSEQTFLVEGHGRNDSSEFVFREEGLIRLVPTSRRYH